MYAQSSECGTKVFAMFVWKPCITLCAGIKYRIVRRLCGESQFAKQIRYGQLPYATRIVTGAQSLRVGPFLSLERNGYG